MRQDIRLLASMAVFRNMYNEDKYDIYGIISELVKDVILTSGVRDFDVFSITNLLNEKYVFDLPEAVVKTAINRLENIDKINGRYVINNASGKMTINENLQKEFELNKSYNIKILDSLIAYIEKAKNATVSESERKVIVDNFCNYMLNEETVSDESSLISAFIMKNMNSNDFISQLRNVREGIILYEGLKYNPNINEIGSWKTNFDIYMETEILFSIGGLNGELFKILLDDLLRYIEEINLSFRRKSSKTRIRMKYFQETKREIETFFTKAERIVKNLEVLDPSKTAMKAIVTGCIKPSDVIVKKNEFYSILSKHGIVEDDYSNYYEEANRKYNIESEEFTKLLNDKLSNEYFDEKLKLLNYINILRKGENKTGFENVRYILLTGNSTTRAIAWDDHIKKEGEVPLATSVDFLTNKFWFKLNKGFGGENLPKSLDIITKARIVLSTHINSSISTDFEGLKTEFNKSDSDKEVLINSYSELRQKSKLPEDITDENIDEIVEFLNEHNIHKYIAESEYQKESKKKVIEENEILKKDIGEIKKESEQDKKELNILRKAECKRKRRIFILKKAITLLLLTIGAVFILRKVFSSPVITTLGTILTILAFFGFDYKNIKKMISDNFDYKG